AMLKSAKESEISEILRSSAKAAEESKLSFAEAFNRELKMILGEKIGNYLKISERFKPIDINSPEMIQALNFVREKIKNNERFQALFKKFGFSPEKKKEFLESLENVIEEVRNEADRRFGKRVTLEELEFIKAITKDKVMEKLNSLWKEIVGTVFPYPSQFIKGGDLDVEFKEIRFPIESFLRGPNQPIGEGMRIKETVIVFQKESVGNLRGEVIVQDIFIQHKDGRETRVNVPELIKDIPDNMLKDYIAINENVIILSRTAEGYLKINYDFVDKPDSDAWVAFYKKRDGSSLFGENGLDTDGEDTLVYILKSPEDKRPEEVKVEIKGFSGPMVTSQQIVQLMEAQAEFNAELGILLNESLKNIKAEKFSLEETDGILTYALMNEMDLRAKITNIIVEKDALYQLEIFKTYDHFGKVNIDKDGLVNAFNNLSAQDRERMKADAVRILLEGRLERDLNLKFYKDRILLDYWMSQYKSNLEEIANQIILGDREKLNGEQKANILTNLIRKIGGEKLAKIETALVGPADWYWREIISNTPLDRMLEMVLPQGFMREILQDTLWNFGQINLNEPREGPFARYFTDYLPNNGASMEEVIRFILQKNKIGPYSEASVGTREDGGAAVTTAGRRSAPVEGMGNPYLDSEVKKFLLLHPEIKALVEELVGPALYDYNPQISDKDLLWEDVRKMVRYFLDTQDLDSGLFLDAGGAIDNSTGVSGFGLNALIIGHQIGEIADAEFARRILKALDFFIDDPNDPNDLSADHWYKIFYHYYQAGSDHRTGANETSTIDAAGLLRAGLEAVVSYTQNYYKGERAKEILEKAKQIISEMDYAAYLAIAGDDGAVFNATLNYGYTKERGVTLGMIDTYHEYILANILGAGGTSPARAIPWYAYYLAGRPEYTGLNGEKFVNTFEAHNPFQYSYPWLQMDSRFLRDKGRELGGEGSVGAGFRSGRFNSQISLNFYRNSILDKKDMIWRMILQSQNFRHLGYHNWGFSSMALPDYYNMDFFLGREGIDRFDGTVTPSEYAMALGFMPGRALDAYKHMMAAYWPFIKGEHWFQDSFNPERHFVSPTEFGLGIGGALLGVWNSLAELEGKQSIWELVGNADNTIRGMLRVGFEEDVSPWFNEHRKEIEQALNEFKQGKDRKKLENEIEGWISKGKIITEIDIEEIEKLTGENFPEFKNRLIQTSLNFTSLREAINKGNKGEILTQFEHILKEAQALSDFNGLSVFIKENMPKTRVRGINGKEVEIFDPEKEINIILFP
ncbi:MAG: hypothetical protein NC898_06530, partial [Candidatus Omnitrophica bacterium]|nr:hypothetical protein [Candidatus Omnitrophota bacterium]